MQRDINKIEKALCKLCNMIPEIINDSYSQRLKDLKLISYKQRILCEQPIEVLKYLELVSVNPSNKLVGVNEWGTELKN